MTNRVSFLIDGFNLYHSICDAIRDRKKPVGKWLNVHALCKNYLYLFGKNAAIQDMYYFSALATHTGNLEAPIRQQALIEAIESTGVKVILGKFKKKWTMCKAGCGKAGWGYEEKETDVNIAITLLEQLMTDSSDTMVIISGDTDLASVVRAAKRLFPQKRVAVGFPYKRANKELRQIAHYSFKIDASYYEKFVFPDVVQLPNSTTISKPTGW